MNQLNAPNASNASVSNTANANGKAAPVAGLKPALSDVQRELRKFATRLSTLKHIDGKALGLDYIFPCLEMLARAVTEHDEQIEGLHDAVEDIANGDVELLTAARDMILKLTSLLDEVTVAAGFFTVSSAGMTDTGKLDALGLEGKTLRRKLLEMGPEVGGVVAEIQGAIDSANTGEDDTEDDDDEDEDEDDTSEAEAAIAVAVAPSVAVVAPSVVAPSAPSVALAPTEVLDANVNESGGPNAA
jgi:hypothetical protein